ncbi:MAG: hypothetical protein K8I27_05930 [Planctomycetes bacterium]|nr:hypothetical protein [Planctomycetota bacterium]
MPRILAGLVLVLALFAGALEARDQVEFGRYLGVRLQMWKESYEVLDKIIDKGSADEKARAKVSKAEVMKAEADDIYSKDQNVEDRNRRYGEAVGVFGDPDTPGGIVSKGVMMLDLALALRRGDPDAARKYCDDAIAMFDAKRLDLDKGRFDGGAGEALFKKEYLNYSRIFFHYCRGFYVKGMTFEFGHPNRENAFLECEKWLGEFLFSLDYPTEEQVMTYPLQGDMELARGNPVDAVTAFEGCVSFLSGESGTYYIGRLAMEHGYLRAAELLTTELDFDPANLRKCIDMYAQAYSRYGQISELEFYFKRFQLYRISALIKLGDEAQIRGAIDLLFKLSGDRDITFRRQALVVLADIATRDSLDNELRFKCASTVYGDLQANSVSVNLKCIQAFQSLIVACKDVKTFETFAPACFTRIGELYSRMWRFLDATLVYREGAYRTMYFRDKFPETGSVPAHMEGRCALITDGKSLYGFPGEMASQAAKHASFLIHPEYGEPENRYFKQLVDDMNILKAGTGTEQALWELDYKKAQELYKDDKNAQAAVRYLSLPARFRSFHIAAYIGAKAYSKVAEDSAAPKVNRRGENSEQESVEWFTSQRARHATDLAALPPGVIAGVDSHWDAILDANTPDQLANWHKAVYYFKKYFLFEGAKAWDDIKASVEAKKNPGIPDIIGAMVEFKNAAWMRDNPSGEGPPDADLKRIGYAVYDMSVLLLNPPDAASDDVKKKLIAQERDLALAVLRPYWTWFGPHLQDSLDYKKYSLRLAFRALADAGDAEACEEVYHAYLESFADDTNQIRYMVGMVYGLLREALTPKTQAMAVAFSKLISMSNLLKKYSFTERINANAKDAQGNPLTTWADDAKRLDEATTAHAKRVVLAEHFWQRWIIELIFEANPHIDEHISDLRIALTDKWNQLAQDYPERWSKATHAEFEAQIKKDAYKSIAAEAKKAAEGAKFDLLDKLDALQSAELKKSDSDAVKVQAYADLLINIRIVTDELAYFTGTIFIYEFGEFLEAQAADVNERARPATTRILKYYEEYRLRRGEGGLDSVDKDAIRTLGSQYFRIRDWRNTVKYLSFFEEKHGGEKVWGKVDSIPVDQRAKTVGKTTSADELEIKYQLGKAHLEIYKEDGNLEDLKKAALYMRRCWCFNLVRDTNTKINPPYKLLFQKELEDNYLYIGDAMAEIYLLLHEAKDVKIEWPKYVDQTTRTLDQNKDHPYQDVPADAPGYLWEATQIHLKVWVQFMSLGRYQFRGDFRRNLERWSELMIRWLETYNADAKGVPALKDDGLQKAIKEAYDMVSRESSLDQTYLPQSIKDYLDRLKGLGKRIEELAKKNKLPLG